LELLVRWDLMALGIIDIALSLFVLFNLIKTKKALGHGIVAEALGALIQAGTLLTIVGVSFSLLVWYTLLTLVTKEIPLEIWLGLDLCFALGAVTYVLLWMTAGKLKKLSGA